ncbi:MAG: hypothetical protein Q8Q67_01695 [bacterium]|nr:hypothetical protein [bacterium]
MLLTVTIAYFAALIGLLDAPVIGEKVEFPGLFQPYVFLSALFCLALCLVIYLQLIV